jgi:hypothetical protein
MDLLSVFDEVRPISNADLRIHSAIHFSGKGFPIYEVTQAQEHLNVILEIGSGISVSVLQQLTFSLVPSSG